MYVTACISNPYTQTIKHHMYLKDTERPTEHYSRNKTLNKYAKLFQPQLLRTGDSSQVHDKCVFAM